MGGGGVGTRNERDKTRRAHSLDIAEGRAGQDTERKQHGESHLLSKDHVERHKGDTKKNVTKRRALTSWRPHREGQVRHI